MGFMLCPPSERRGVGQTDPRAEVAAQVHGVLPRGREGTSRDSVWTLPASVSDTGSVRHERPILGRVRYSRVAWTLLLPATSDWPPRNPSKSLFGMNEEPSPLLKRPAGNFGFGKHRLN